MQTNLPQPHEQGPPPGYGWSQGAPVLFEAEETGGQVNVRRLVNAVWRHKWLVLVVTLVGTAAGLLYVRTLPDEYVASATVWIEPRAAAGGPIRPAQLLSAPAWIELLRSYVVLDEVVLQERLFLEARNGSGAALFNGVAVAGRLQPGEYRLELNRRDGQFRLINGGGAVVESGEIGDVVGESIGLSWQPAPEELGNRTRIDFRVITPREAATRLASTMEARVDRTGNFLRLQLRGPSPERTAGILNAVTERFVGVAGDLKRGHLVELVSILEEQLDYAQSNLEEAERDLEAFRVATITLPTEQSAPVAAGLEMTASPVYGGFFQLRLEQEQVRRDRQAILSAISGGTVSVEALEVVPATATSSQLRTALNELTQARAELRALQYRYTDEHAPVQELADRVRRLEQGTVPELARSLVAQLSARDRAIQDQIGSTSREMEQIPPRVIEEARLRRQVAVSADLYTTLQRRFEETRLASASTVPDIRILDRASATQSPLGDGKSRLLLMAVLGSFALGLLGALARDRFDHTIHYADQVSDDMGLTVLGAVPELGERRRHRDGRVTAEALEAFRGIRMNMMYAHGAAGPVVAAISSPGPGDGKSFVTSNLALSFADLGKRVLLIDGDVRRGTLHRVMSRHRAPGLTDYLVGEVARERLIQDTPYKNVRFLATGKLKLAGPELISSAPMRTLLADLRNDYDVILIDTAPLGAGVDPFIFGTLTGNLILVLRTGTTNRDLAEAKLDLVSRLPIRILGTVINGLKDRDLSHYHRYYSYLPGYEATDEEEPSAPMLPKVPS
jgi:polysaccharide biosynthesis transport protein